MSEAVLKKELMEWASKAGALSAEVEMLRRERDVLRKAVLSALEKTVAARDGLREALEV